MPSIAHAERNPTAKIAIYGRGSGAISIAEPAAWQMLRLPNAKRLPIALQGLVVAIEYAGVTAAPAAVPERGPLRPLGRLSGPEPHQQSSAATGSVLARYRVVRIATLECLEQSIRLLFSALLAQRLDFLQPRRWRGFTERLY